MSKRHHFVESDSRHEYLRVIYCTACGMVVWNWNANSQSTPSTMDYQAKVGNPCIEVLPSTAQKSISEEEL